MTCILTSKASWWHWEWWFHCETCLRNWWSSWKWCWAAPIVSNSSCKKNAPAESFQCHVPRKFSKRFLAATNAPSFDLHTTSASILQSSEFLSHPFRPNQNEGRVHQAAERHGFGLGCTLEWRHLPVCTGHDTDGNPIVELKNWPFIFPHTMVSWWIHGIPFADDVFFWVIVAKTLF